MDPSLPRELLQAVYLATVEGRFMDEKAFEEKRFKIQRQEWPYYRQAYREELPEEEDYRTDEDGGIGYPLYYNFLSYVQWKAVAGNLNGRKEKDKFIRYVGRYAWDSFKSGIDWQDANLRRALSNVLDAFVDGGYMADYEIVWDDLQVSVPTLEQQWKIESNFQGETESLPAVFQVRLKDPADIIGSVALRAEEDGFWQRCISSVLGAFLEDRGFQSAVDEYIFQDKWAGPRTLGGRILLLLGDPLQQVDVPFQPNAILQEWHTCKTGENAACDTEGWKSSGFFVY